MMSINRSILFINFIFCLFIKVNSIVWMDENFKFDCSMVYHKEGDINLGVVLPLGCNTKYIRLKYYRTVPFLLAVDDIDKNPNLLSNITLGFTILNNCHGNTEQRLIQFLPDTGPQFDENYCKNGKSHPVWFDVVGVISTTFSRESVDFSYITKLQNIPLFTSAEATSDEFTNKDRFPYFFRTVSGDSKQVDFMLHFLRALKWVYVNVIYTIGPYGENAAKQLNLKAEAFGICIEVFHMVIKIDERAMDDAVKRLQKHQKAKVLIGFFERGGDLFEEAILRKNAEKDFIFLGSDTVYFNFNGVFRVQPVRTIAGSFYSRIEEFFYQRDAKLFPEDPWIRNIYADKHNCSWDFSETENSCNSIESDQQVMDFSIPQTFEDRRYIRVYDVVHLYAKGIDKTIQTNCQYISLEDKKQLRNCVKDNLIPNMKFIENEGTVKIKLDENGDAYARWRIYQNQNGTTALIATYDETEEPKLRLSMELINWSMFSHFSTQNLTIQNQTVRTPESVCSKPCRPKEYLIQQELPCCWDCRKCYVNEYIVNGTSCQPCPFGQWPDEDTATYCTIIEKTYLKWSSWITLLLAGVIVFGLFFTIYAAIFYFRKRQEKIIKATTRELCCIILFGTSMAYLIGLFYFFKPAYWSCLINRHGFNLSVILIYAPLFVKTNRVYRIFHAGKKGIKRAKYIDTSTQIMISTVLILIQVGLSICSEILDPTAAVKKMPIETQPYLELYCKLELRALLIPLVYNLVIILLCAVHGFLTRSLPENFNESRYIFVSVMTTTFLWVVFIPTYFTTFYAYHKSILLATCLILNATITLLLLFCPKIYAVYFVNDSKIKYQSSSRNLAITDASADSSTFKYTLKQMAKRGEIANDK